MPFAPHSLHDLSLFGNVGPSGCRQLMEKHGSVIVLLAWIGERNCCAFLNKTNNLVYADGLKLMVSRVWTETARPFMA